MRAEIDIGLVIEGDEDLVREVRSKVAAPDPRE
jgi:hypothetical protein